MPTYNPEQQAAIDSKAKHLLILAGAGTGKSHTLLGRIKRMIDEGADPQSILALTFTNAAAFEMKDRFKRQNPEARSIPEFRTFHSFCYSLIGKDMQIRNKLGYFAIPKIADETVMKRIEAHTKLQIGNKVTDSMIHRKRALSEKEEFELAVYRKAFDRNLRREGYITFDMLCYEVCKLFEDNDPVILKYKQQYKHLLIDEFQDTDTRQHRFAMSFEDADICVVGDALQNLYSFRGTTAEIIKSLAEDSSWETVRLTRNYRSTIQICDFANSHSLYAKDEYRIPIWSDRDGYSVNVIPCNYNRSQEVGIRTIINTLKEIPETSDVAVLVRTNNEVSYLYEQLTEQGINCRLGKPNADAIHMLRCCVEKDYCTDWLSSFLNSVEYAEFQRVCNVEHTVSKYDLLMKWFYNKPAISKRIDYITKLSFAMQESDIPYQKANAMFEVLGYKNIQVETTAHNDLELVEYMVATIEQMQQAGVYIGTIHSSKGLEYEMVFLIGVGGKSFRLTNEDNNNLYYVGITRAKDRLFVIGEDF